MIAAEARLGPKKQQAMLDPVAELVSKVWKNRPLCLSVEHKALNLEKVFGSG